MRGSAAKAKRSRIDQILKELDVRHFNLTHATMQLIGEGIDVQEIPGDYWHPSDAAAGRLAQHLFDAGLLAER